MKVYIVQLHYNYEGFSIDGVYRHEEDAERRVAEVDRIIKLPFGHKEHQYLCDQVSYEEVDVKRKGAK